MGIAGTWRGPGGRLAAAGWMGRCDPWREYSRCSVLVGHARTGGVEWHANKRLLQSSTPKWGPLVTRRRTNVTSFPCICFPALALALHHTPNQHTSRLHHQWRLCAVYTSVKPKSSARTVFNQIRRFSCWGSLEKSRQWWEEGENTLYLASTVHNYASYGEQCESYASML